MAEIQRQRTIDGQKHSIAYLTGEELNAVEALRKETGLRGRLARRGKHMKPKFVGGKDKVRALPPVNEGGEESEFGKTEDSGAPSNYDNNNNNNNNNSGGGETAEQKAAREAAAAAAAEVAAEKARVAKEKADALEKVKTDRVSRRKGLVEGTMEDASGVAEGTKGVFTDSAGKVEGDEGFNPDDEAGTMVGAYDESTGKLNTEGSLEGIRTDYKGLRDKADYSETRSDLAGYQTEADKLKTEAGTKFGGYESQISKMPDRAGQVAGYGEDVAGLRAGVGTDVTAGKAGMETARQEAITAGGEFRDMASKAQDTGSLMKDRGLFAGQMEAKRKAGQKGKLANLRRSMAAGGASPQEIARAEAEASSAGGQESREDALAASMASMQSGRQGLSQAAGMTGQGMSASGMQAQMAGQQAALGMQGRMQQGQLAGQAAGMAGQAQQLGLGKIGAQAGMYGQGLQAQTGLMNMGSSLANQQQASLQNEISQQSNLTGNMAGMTEAQLQDVVAQQNTAQQEKLAREGLLAAQQTNAANQPKGPSQSEQLMGLVKTGASVKIAMMCIPEGTKIDTPDGGVSIEEIKAGDFVIGMDGKDDEVLQVHQYKEDPEPVRFATVTFDDGSTVDCCDKHRISGKRTEDYRPQDKVGSRKVTDIDWYNGVSRSYDLLTATGGYRINGVPVNTMIPEMAEMITELNKNIKLAA